MQTTTQRLACAALMTLALAGCAGTSGVVERFADRSPDELLSQASQQQGSEAATTRVEAVELLQRQGSSERALEVADNINRSALDAPEQTRLAIATARAAADLQDSAALLEATSILERDIAIPTDARRELLERRSQALSADNRPFEAATTLIELQGITDDTGLNDNLWRELNRLEAGDLDTLSSQSPLAAGWVELARLQNNRGGSLGELSNAISRWQSNNPRHPASRRLPTDLSRLDELQSEEVRRIAVLLPSAGPLESIATAIRTGLETRAETVRREGGSAPTLAFIDSHEQELEALYARATMEGAQAVIGPLSKDQVSQLETRQSVPLPTLALNYGTHERNGANSLFQYGLSTEDEARQAARRAREDGHRRAGILVPDNDWGARVLSAFQRAWQESGGEISSVVNYSPSASATSAVRSALQDGRSRPDMLFLLALPAYARQVPPTLDYYDAASLPVYATSHAYEGSPQSRIDHDLDDVMFVDIPWSIPQVASSNGALPFDETRRALMQNGGDRPDMLRLQAMGVDAFELARQLPIMNAIGNFRMQGATGDLAPRDDGRVVRTLPWAQFRGGEPAPLAAPTSL